MVGEMKKLLVLFILLISLTVVVAQTSMMEITNYESNILIEKGWIRYISVDVENTGDTYLNNVDVFVQGEKSGWFEADTNRTVIPPNQSASFLLKLYVPLDEEGGKYSFTLFATSDELTASEDFTIEIFSSRTEMLLDEIQNFREKISEIKSGADDAEIRGKNVDSVKVFLSEASPILEAASNDVSNNLLDDATQKIRDAEVLITKAEYDLSVAATNPIVAQAAPIPLEWILIIVLSIIIILLFLWFFVLKKSVYIRAPGKIPGLKIKRLIKQEKNRRKPEDDVKSLEEAASLLEEEYREGLISKESYEEMKSKYEEKILSIKTQK
jgi:hypothetical protein